MNAPRTPVPGSAGQDSNRHFIAALAALAVLALGACSGPGDPGKAAVADAAQAGGPVAIAPSVKADCAQAASLGCWLPPFSEDGPDADGVGDFDQFPPQTEAEAARFPTAVSMAVLPDGRILYWNGFEGDDQLDGPRIIGGLPPPGSRARSRVLNLSEYVSDGADPRVTARWLVPGPEDGGGGDLFCSDISFLPSGELVAVGGQVNYDHQGAPYGSGSHLIEYEGIADVRSFDWRTDQWRQLTPMNWERWYPTLLNLPDSDHGELLVTSGVYQLVFNSEQQNVEETEIYRAADNRWSDTGSAGSQSLPLYPRLHLLPQGKVLYAGSGHMWNAFGQSISEAEWAREMWFDPATLSWSMIGPAANGGRNGSFSVLMPLRPDPSTGTYRDAELLVGGGTIGVSPSTILATELVERVSWHADAPESVSTTIVASLPAPRWAGGAVLLPSGELVVVSGADRDHLWGPGEERPVREAALYDPRSGNWRDGAAAARDRTYHNSALLLPDGSVLVGGHAPHPLDYGQRHETRAPGAHNFRDSSFEIYRPPYLYRGARPVITEVPEIIPRNSRFEIETPDAGAASLQVVLSRLPSVTHGVDADQRTVEVAIQSRGEERIELRIPANRAAVPGGHYYLFLVTDNGQGPTPSVAQIVQISG